MARLIVKSPYIQCGKQNADGYLRYIATRERVEIIPDDRPPTRKQDQLITKLTKDFPDVKELLEYADYMQKPTKANASSLITLALEEHWKQVQQTDGYMKYIATRPRAERLGDHGLFGDTDHVDLDSAMSELEHYTVNVWTHILSLHREDAERLGYNNAQAWRALLRAHRNDIAAAMHIPPQDFRWYAAFHNEGHHPHIHMMAWSVKPGQAHLDRNGIRSIRSQLTNDIFQQELLHVYEQKSVSRDELVKETRKVMLELSCQMRDTICEHTQAEQMIWKLSQQLGEVKGKKSYGYLPRPMKRQVDEIVDQLECIPVVNECYQKWWELQCQVNEFYSGKKQQRPPLSKQKEFRAIRNAVIREAENIRLGKEYLTGRSVRKDAVKAVEYVRHAADQNHPWASYLLGKLYLTGNGVPKDEEAAWNCFRMANAFGHPYARYVLERQEQWQRPELLLTVSRLFYHMSNIFRDNAPTVPAQPRLHIDRKRMRELQELRIALGHQPDDHEEEQTQTQNWGGMTMKGW